MALQANINRDRKQRSQPFSYQDFMPKFGKEQPKKQTPEEQIKILNSFFGK